jgi:hypothetical protein
MKYKLHITILILAIIVAVLGYKHYSIRKSSQENTQTVQNPESERLSDTEYEAVRTKYLKIIDQQNPRVALDALDQEIQTNKPLLRSCHALTHEMGHEAYKKYNSFSTALKYQSEICNTGYMHGVIETHFSKVTDVFAEMKTICEGEDFGRCYHGVGHGVMYYTSNNLPKSLEMCNTYDTQPKRNYCAQGVYMENFNTDRKLHPSEYLKENDPFYPCGEAEPNFKAICYVYAPMYYMALHNDDGGATLNWCLTAETGFEQFCIRGTGNILIKYNINEPKIAEQQCNQLQSGEYRDYCIDGMIGLYINHYDSLQKGVEMCKTLDPENQPACNAGIKSRESLFKGQNLTD